ncbi:MAG: acyltransferase [Pleurocapsa sp. MO_192.B19]|nr:acyltransferase [Pleurocapsa sp. MO_192.B19]
MKSLALSQNIWNRFWKTWQSVGIKGITSTIWSFFWMRFAGLRYGGRIATWLATWLAPPYKKRRPLARYNSKGYIAPSATIYHGNLQLGANIFIGDRVAILQYPAGGSIDLGARVHLHNDTVLQTSDGGQLTIGQDTHIQPDCQFFASQGSIHIGSEVQIASDCIFNSHPADRQGHQSKTSARTDIIIDDDVWIAHGVTVLPGVSIGAGAVIGSGSVVTQSIPTKAIAVGIPARVIKMRA